MSFGHDPDLHPEKTYLVTWWRGACLIDGARSEAEAREYALPHITPGFVLTVSEVSGTDLEMMRYWLDAHGQRRQ